MNAKKGGGGNLQGPIGRVRDLWGRRAGENSGRGQNQENGIGGSEKGMHETLRLERKGGTTARRAGKRQRKKTGTEKGSSLCLMTLKPESKKSQIRGERTRSAKER